MTTFERPSGAYTGAGGLANRTKYQDDAQAVPKVAISSAKMDGDFNYLVDALNTLHEARGSRASIDERLDVVLNDDGTLKASVVAGMDDWLTLSGAGALARVNDTTVTLGGGDFTGVLAVNRRVKLVVVGAPLVGDVASVSHAAGTTTLVVKNLVDVAGVDAVVSSAPSSVAYGPLLPGITGNAMRVVDALTVGGYELAADGSDLALVPVGGSGGVMVTPDGVSGVAPGAVGVNALDAGVTAKLVPSGAVMPFAGASAPTGWLVCGGQAVSRTTYADLFAAIGTTYGAGDGSTTFALPDLRGRAVFGVDNMNGAAAGRVTAGVSGLTGATLGAVGGNEAMHQHTHTATVTDPGHAHDTRGASGSGVQVPSTESGGQDGAGSRPVVSATTGITVANADSGSGSSENMPPAMMLNYIIKA